MPSPPDTSPDVEIWYALEWSVMGADEWHLMDQRTFDTYGAALAALKKSNRLGVARGGFDYRIVSKRLATVEVKRFQGAPSA